VVVEGVSHPSLSALGVRSKRFSFPDIDTWDEKGEK